MKVINHDCEPFFYGSELAKMLNFVRPGNALENHVSEENKIKVQIINPGRRVLINEIVDELIFSSNLPQAKEFRNFVFRVVLPNFRKQLISNPKLIGHQFVIKNEMLYRVGSINGMVAHTHTRESKVWSPPGTK